jgi:hypothetical protein
MDEDSWWCGEGSGILESFLYDKSIQTEEETVLLYTLTNNTVKRFKTADIRSNVKAEKNELQVKIIKSNYRNWISQYREDLQSIIKVEQTLIEIHQSRLKKLGFDYKGIRRNLGAIQRASFCWSCKGSLNSEIDLECVACGWILCGCGACGCGYGC